MKTGSATFNIRNLLDLDNSKVYIGFVLFAIALVVWIFILKKLPLNVAQAFSVLQFVGVILASWLLLSEPISGLRWVGIAFVFLGVIIVGWTAK
ncbi:EamA family transporter [Methylomonas albis]|uniref:EamA family transporter n=1 Tax=Methylomonas albis TaxID=1854563 RepID=A0ABR9D0U6_9GAMM|nr:EamA family transporter [Methylomonas albis]MBD9356717.1 EamA family transporter [Methylomonas albis]